MNTEDTLRARVFALEAEIVRLKESVPLVTKALVDLEEENRRLKQETERLRDKYEPKPVVYVRYCYTDGKEFTRGLSESRTEGDNCRLTFTDGVLTHAEVLK